MWSLITMLACAPDAEAPGPTEGEKVTSPSESLDDTEPSPTPAWTASQAFGRLDALDGLPMAPELLDSYFSALGYGDDACPGLSGQFNGSTYEGCTSVLGAWYQGLAIYQELQWEDEGGAWDVRELGTDFVILYPDGRRFDAGGSVGSRVHTDDGVTEWISDVRGTYRDDGATGALAIGFSTYLVATGRVDGAAYGLDGALGLADLTMGFGGLRVEPACGFVGEVAIRDPSGPWYRLDFGASCAPCGRVTLDGADADDASDELCADPEHLAGLIRGGLRL